MRFTYRRKEFMAHNKIKKYWYNTFVDNSAKSWKVKDEITEKVSRKL